jgi:hypothetical protein
MEKPMSDREEGGGGAGIVAGLALILSLVAIGGVAYLWFLKPDPLGKGLKAYDVSTPAAMMKAELQMRANGDIKAFAELERKGMNKELKEEIDTLEVKKEATWGTKTILFVTYKNDGKPKYETRGFEKNAESGLWDHSYVSALDVEKDNKKLADMMRSWQDSGSLEPKVEPPKP